MSDKSLMKNTTKYYTRAENLNNTIVLIYRCLTKILSLSIKIFLYRTKEKKQNV